MPMDDSCCLSDPVWRITRAGSSARRDAVGRPAPTLTCPASCGGLALPPRLSSTTQHDRISVPACRMRRQERRGVPRLVNIAMVWTSACRRAFLFLIFVDHQWFGIGGNGFLIDHNLVDLIHTRQLEHRVEQNAFEDRA